MASFIEKWISVWPYEFSLQCPYLALPSPTLPYPILPFSSLFPFLPFHEYIYRRWCWFDPLNLPLPYSYLPFLTLPSLILPYPSLPLLHPSLSYLPMATFRGIVVGSAFWRIPETERKREREGARNLEEPFAGDGRGDKTGPFVFRLTGIQRLPAWLTSG